MNIIEQRDYDLQKLLEIEKKVDKLFDDFLDEVNKTFEKIERKEGDK